MRFNFLKTALIFILSLLSFTTAFANQDKYQSAKEKNYIVRVTARTPGKVVPISGSFLHIQRGATTAGYLPEGTYTPYELNVHGYFVGAMFFSTMGMKSRLADDDIKVEYLYKDSKGEHLLLESESWASFGYVDVDGGFVQTG